MTTILGKGSESTLRIDEPLHFIFLVAYLITYFCCAYLLFICFKHCRRLLKRKEKQRRPASFDRLRSVAEAMNNLHCGTAGYRNVQVTVGTFGEINSELCQDSCNGADNESSQSSLSGEDNTLTNTSILITPMPTRRTRPDHHRVAYLTIEHDLPDYDTVSQSEVEQESPPPSYTECMPMPVTHFNPIRNPIQQLAVNCEDDEKLFCKILLDDEQ